MNNSFNFLDYEMKKYIFVFILLILSISNTFALEIIKNIKFTDTVLQSSRFYHISNNDGGIVGLRRVQKSLLPEHNFAKQIQLYEKYDMDLNFLANIQTEKGLGQFSDNLIDFQNKYYSFFQSDIGDYLHFVSFDKDFSNIKLNNLDEVFIDSNWYVENFSFPNFNTFVEKNNGNEELFFTMANSITYINTSDTIRSKYMAQLYLNFFDINGKLQKTFKSDEFFGNTYDPNLMNFTSQIAKQLSNGNYLLSARFMGDKSYNYTQYVYCFTPSGKLLWKTVLPETSMSRNWKIEEISNYIYLIGEYKTKVLFEPNLSIAKLNLQGELVQLKKVDKHNTVSLTRSSIADKDKIYLFGLNNGASAAAFTIIDTNLNIIHNEVFTKEEFGSQFTAASKIADSTFAVGYLTKYSNLAIVKMSSTTTDVKEVNSSFYTGLPYPNPFASETVIEFSLTKDELVTIELFSSAGEKVATLEKESLKSIGTNRVYIKSDGLAQGVYFVKITAGNNSEIREVIISK